jgi:hypothetical protein
MKMLKLFLQMIKIQMNHKLNRLKKIKIKYSQKKPLNKEDKIFNINKKSLHDNVIDLYMKG